MRTLLWSGVFPQVRNFFIKLIIIVSLCFFFHAGNSSAKTDDEDGLGLQEKVSKMAVETVAYDNPHLKLACDECHAKKVTKRTRKRDAKLKFKNSVELCNSCHKGANLHPVGVDPLKTKPAMKTPQYLPLGKRGKYKNKVVCTTCHEIHVEKTKNYLLRGFEGTAASYARLEKRQDFCKSCHKDALTKRSPHDGDKKACVFCHVTDPEETDEPVETVRLDMIRRCNFCHMKLEGAHFLTVNAFADKALQADIPNLDLPFIGGNITCVTCHDQHFDTSIPHRLRPAFVAFAEKSVRINPHWKGAFCLSCHDKTPKKGETPTFLFDGDIIKVCNRCHGTEEATADIHPVGMTPFENDSINIPDEFPLRDGVVVCTTCHDLTTQTKIDEKQRSINPLFLRGAPYETRNDICFKCHDANKYPQQSPHQQLDDDGNIIESKCLFCHSSRPDIEVVGIRPKMFKGDVSTFCYGCHAGKQESHPVGVTHLGRDPSEERRKCIKKTEKEQFIRLPLFNDKLFCGTCHNPHQRGVLKGAAQAGAGKENKLRLPQGYEMCVACHCDKGSIR